MYTHVHSHTQHIYKQIHICIYTDRQTNIYKQTHTHVHTQNCTCTDRQMYLNYLPRVLSNWRISTSTFESNDSTLYCLLINTIQTWPAVRTILTFPTERFITLEYSWKPIQMAGSSCRVSRYVNYWINTFHMNIWTLCKQQNLMYIFLHISLLLLYILTVITYGIKIY